MEQIDIEVKLTDTCNQHCTHCANEDSARGSGLLETCFFLRRLKEFLHAGSRGTSIRSVRVTGGEPLLYPSRIKRLASACKAHGIRCGVNSNGILLSRAMAEDLRSFGVDLVKISLDAVDEHVLTAFRGAPVSVQAIVDAIANAKAAGMEVIARFSLCRITAAQMIPCYRLAEEHGADLFQVKPVIGTGRAEDSGTFLSAGKIGEDLRRLAAAARRGKTRVQALCLPAELAGGLDAKTCGSANKIYVRTDATVCICNFVPQAVTIGDLKREPLAAILERRREHLRTIPDGKRIVAACPQVPLFDNCRRRRACSTT
jgi:MoaA/NifB/PqqE/SkfB family radical SAM enzyme